MWRSWLAHLLWEQRVVGSSPITPTMIIQAKGIEKSYGQLKVLKGLEFSAAPASITAIMGASGAGKTTLLQILGTLSRPDAGTLEIDGTNVLALGQNALSDFRCRKIGFVFQFHNLLPEFTSLENIMIPALIAGRSKADAKARAQELLGALGLEERAAHKPDALSGGEQQRVAIARALVNSPAVLLADEPSGNLDSANKDELHKLLLSLRQSLGQTIVIVTHDPQLAALCDTTLNMKDGLFV